MNPLSLHISGPNGRRDGLGAWLEQLSRAGCTTPVLYSVNVNIAADIAALSPGTRWIYRRQDETFERLPDDWWQGDPRANARRWITETRNGSNRTMLQEWQLNNADWFDPLNEPIPGTVDQAKWLNEWMLEALLIANEHGMRLALFSFATGSPDYALWDYLIPAMQFGKLHGAVLSLHAYNDGGLAECDENGNLTPAALHSAFRHEEIYRRLPDSAQLPIVYSEASMGNGFGMQSTDVWIADLIDYGLRIKNDARVLSVCAYQCGGSESNCYQALPAYADAIVVQDWSVEPPPPPDEYHFVHWLVNGVVINANPWKFTMPDEDVTIVAVYSTSSNPPVYRTFTITTQPSGYENRLTVEGVSNGQAEVGKMVRIVAA